MDSDTALRLLAELADYKASSLGPKLTLALKAEVRRLTDKLAEAERALASMRCTCSRRDDWGNALPDGEHRQSCDYGRAQEALARIQAK